MFISISKCVTAGYNGKGTKFWGHVWQQLWFPDSHVKIFVMATSYIMGTPLPETNIAIKKVNTV
jgi:hypothetical protein